MPSAYIILGSNTPRKGFMLEKAESILSQRVGEIYVRSSLYQTEPWGFTSDEDFLNRVLCMDTRLTPARCMDECLKAEQQLGRIRSGKRYESRTIDIDILFYDTLIIKRSGLQIPHPRLHLRRFVLQPLDEIIPLFIHPLLNKTIHELLEECTDPCRVSRVEE